MEQKTRVANMATNLYTACTMYNFLAAQSMLIYWQIFIDGYGDDNYWKVTEHNEADS